MGEKMQVYAQKPSIETAKKLFEVLKSEKNPERRRNAVWMLNFTRGKLRETALSDRKGNYAKFEEMLKSEMNEAVRAGDKRTERDLIYLEFGRNFYFEPRNDWRKKQCMGEEARALIGSELLKQRLKHHTEGGSSGKLGEA
ncbi:MAG: hypothetical protein ABIH99_02640 [Candidatus Micrarchaeota archaeon]